MSDRKASMLRSALISAALVLLIAIAFAPVRHNGFVDYDDNQYLIENSHIQSGFTTESVGWAFTSGYASNWHPLTWLSHMVDIELFGLNPLGHHLHNLFLHALATVLLFLLLQSMTGATWRSAFVALAFGIHPLRVESVVWIAERKDVLSAVFWMLTLLAYSKYAESKARSSRRQGAPFECRMQNAECRKELEPPDVGCYKWYGLALLFFALGLMSKPMLVTLPLILLLLDYWPLGRFAIYDIRFTIGKLVREKVPFFVLAFASSIVTFLVQEHGKSVAFDLPLTLRIFNALTSYVAYLANTLWPHNVGALIYPYPTEWPLWKPILCGVILVGITTLVLHRSARQPWLAAGWLWFGIALVPVIGLIQVGSQSMADRYSYLPSIGLFIMLSWALTQWLAGWKNHRVLLGAAAALAALAMIVQTRTQTACWKDSATLFEHALAVTHNNYRMHYNLGWTLAKQNRFDEAIAQFNRALELRPDDPDANLDLADLLIKRQQYDDALLHLDRVLKVEPDNALAHYDRGVVLQSQEKFDDAIQAYQQAVRCDQKNARAWNNLGILKTGNGRLAEAADCFRQSLRITPDKAETHRNLGIALQMQNQIDEAVLHFRVALKLNPNDPETSWNAAYALHSLGKVQEATELDRRTLQLQPDHVRALNDLAWILATAPDSDVRNSSEAIALARKACELSAFKEADLLDTLATAHASAKQFTEAIDMAEKAIELAKAAGQQELAEDIGKRLQLYRTSVPYLEPPTPLAANK